MSEQHEATSDEAPLAGFETESISNDLRKLASRPVNEHPAVFEAIHRELHSALQDLDNV